MIIVLIILTHGFIHAQNVIESEAVNAAVRFVSELKQTVWTNDSVSGVSILNRNNGGIIYEVIGCDGCSVLLSGRKECEPILGYIPAENKPFSGALIDHFSELPDGLRGLLDDYSEQVLYCTNHAVPSTCIEKWNRLLDGKSTALTSSAIQIPALINTKWGQAKSNDGYTGAYNHYCFDTNACTNCPAGCVAVAMAQVMRYWLFPLNIPWRCNQFDWSNMPNQLIGKNNSHYIQQREAISKLIHNCGTSVHTDYCPNSQCQSGIPYYSMGNIITALKDTFGYSETMVLNYKDAETNWETLLLNELQQSRPIIYFGMGSGGHAFICDGCIADTIQQLYYFHFNWGWTGTADGYFPLSALRPDDGHTVHDYSSFQGAIFHIFPSDCFQNIIMECNNDFAHTAIRTISTVNDFQNNYHLYRIRSGAKVHLYAGHEIFLTNGFYAEQNAVFTAAIAPCGSSSMTTFSDIIPDLYGSENSTDTLPAPKSLQTEATQSGDAALTVYPNPTDDLLYIELSGAGIATVALYDLQGRVVTGTHTGAPQQGGTATMSMRNVPAGVYVLRVTDADGKEYRQKVVRR